jgi:ribonuclease R
MGLVGQRTGRRWQLGDTVRVRLNRVDLTQRQIDFELVDADAAATRGTVRAPRQGQRAPQARRSGSGASQGRQGRQGRGGTKRGGRGGRG